jgi:hypothetical protein
MSFFPVDDRFHSHPKAAAVSLAAIGLWTMAGSWARGHPSNGDVPGHVVTSLSRGATELAEELVTVGLWRRTKAGYRFHQWQQRNPTLSESRAALEKKSRGGLLGAHRRWHGIPNGIPDPKCPFCVTDQPQPAIGTDGSTHGPPNGYANPPLPLPLPLIKPSSPGGDEPAGFAEFWRAYPPRKNNSKHKARLAYAAALHRGVDPAVVLAAAETYAKDRQGQDPQYTKHAVTWLHARPWEDPEPAAAPPRAKFAWEN